MLSFLDKIPFLDSILFDLELGTLISLFGLKKFLLLELLATPAVGFVPDGVNEKPLK